jgi:hypothetical protein
MRLQISHRHPLYFHFIGLLLDLIDATSGHLADAAGVLGLSTSTVVKCLADDPHLWATANQICAKHLQPPIRMP